MSAAQIIFKKFAEAIAPAVRQFAPGWAVRKIEMSRDHNPVLGGDELTITIRINPSALIALPDGDVRIEDQDILALDMVEQAAERIRAEEEAKKPKAVPPAPQGDAWDFLRKHLQDEAARHEREQQQAALQPLQVRFIDAVDVYGNKHVRPDQYAKIRKKAQWKDEVGAGGFARLAQAEAAIKAKAVV